MLKKAKSKNEEEKIDPFLRNIEEIKCQKIDLQRTITQLESMSLLAIKRQKQVTMRAFELR